MIVLIVRGGYVAQQPRMRGMQGEEDGSRALGELGTATADHRAPPNRAYATTASAISFGYRSPLMCSQPRPARGSPVLSAPERDGQPPTARSLTSQGFVLTCRPGPRRPSQHPFPFRFVSFAVADRSIDHHYWQQHDLTQPIVDYFDLSVFDLFRLVESSEIS